MLLNTHSLLYDLISEGYYCFLIILRALHEEDIAALDEKVFSFCFIRFQVLFISGHCSYQLNTAVEQQQNKSINLFLFQERPCGLRDC